MSSNLVAWVLCPQVAGHAIIKAYKNLLSWGDMTGSVSYSRGHLRQEILIGGISNAIFNGLIAWWMLRSGPPLSWGGEPGFAMDIIATGLLLPLIIAAIVIPLQRGKLRRGKLRAIDLGPSSTIQSIANRMPASTWKSALLFGLFGMCVIAPLTLLGFYLAGVEQVAPVNYAIFKGIWAGLIAALLVVPMVLIALRGPGPSSALTQ